MNKKAKIAFWLSAVLICIALYVMPQMVQSSIPSAYYITPAEKTYENQVICSGTIQSNLIRTIYSDTPIVASDIHITVGDRVSQGDILLTIDLERSKQLSYSPLYFLQELTGDALTNRTNMADWSAAAAAYGITLDGSEQYSQDFTKIMQDMGLVSIDESTGFFVAETREMVAPVSGVITDVSVRQNVPHSAGKAIITIADDTSYKVTAQVNESDIGMVKLGDNACIRGVGFGGSTYTGQVTKISPTARKSLNGTTTETVVDVEIQIADADEQLKAGFTAKVEITGGEDYSLLTVPYEAVRQDENNNEYVYIYDDGKVKKTPITTGKELTSEVQVLAGIDEDSIVIFNPSDTTKEGSMIHIKGRADAN